MNAQQIEMAGYDDYYDDGNYGDDANGGYLLIGIWVALKIGVYVCLALQYVWQHRWTVLDWLCRGAMCFGVGLAFAWDMDYVAYGLTFLCVVYLIVIETHAGEAEESDKSAPKHGS